MLRFALFKLILAVCVIFLPQRNNIMYNIMFCNVLSNKFKDFVINTQFVEQIDFCSIGHLSVVG